MKNKKLLAVAAGICLFATVGYANNYLISGLGFVAPSIIGKSNIYNPEVGEIVYDSVDATFYGYDHNNQWQALSGGGSTSPAGVMLAFGGATAPTGYLICDGSPVSRTTYSSLYAAIGDSYGAGDGVNTFNLPDLRGRFLRGVDAGAGRDPGGRIAMNVGGDPNAVGSRQDDALANHAHQAKVYYAGGGAAGLGRIMEPSHAGSTITATVGVVGTNVSTETRPENVSVNYIIKI